MAKGQKLRTDPEYDFELIGRRAVEANRVKDYADFPLKDERGEYTGEWSVVCYDLRTPYPRGMRAVILPWPVRGYVDDICTAYLFVWPDSTYKEIRSAVRDVRRDVALHYASPEDDDWYDEAHIPEEEIAFLNAAEVFWYLMMRLIQEDPKTTRKLDALLGDRDILLLELKQ